MFDKENVSKVILLSENSGTNSRYYCDKPWLLLGETKNYYIIHHLGERNFEDRIHYILKAEHVIEDLELSLLPPSVQKVFHKRIKEILSGGKRE